MKTIIINEFRAFIRNPYYVGLLIIFPILLIYILGNFLEQVQVADTAIGTVHVQYYIEEKSENQTDIMPVLLEKYREGMEKEKTISFTKCADKEEGIKLLQEGKLDSFLVYESGILSLYEGTDILINNTVKSMVSGLVETRNTYTGIGTYNPISLSSITMKQDDFTVNNKLTASMSMLDYYAIAMAIMTAVLGCIVSSLTFSAERSYRTLNRLLIIPQSKFGVFTGKIISMIPQAALQIGLIMLVSSLLFKASYGDGILKYTLVFILLTLTSVTSSAIGALLGLIFKKSLVVELYAVTFLLLFFSGIYATSMAIEPLCNYLPPYIIRKAALSLTLFGENKQAVTVILVEIVMIVIVTMLGGWIFSRQKEVRE